MNPYLPLLLSAVAASVGQILFRKGAMAARIHPDGTVLQLVAALLLNRMVFVGLVLYALSTILWLVGLSKVRLNAAYPFTALTFVLVMLGSRTVLEEGIPPLRLLGVVLILGGFMLCSAAPR